MNHDELRDSIPALALNALPEREQLLIEAHVARCSGCSFEYRQYQEVAALLAHLAPPVAPPPGLWDRIEERMDEEVARPASVLAPPPPAAAAAPNGRRRPAGRRTRFARQHVAALAAAAFLVAVVVGVSMLHRPGAPGRGARGDLFEAIASGPHTVVPMHPTALAPGASGEIFVAPDGKVAVSMHGLRSPGSGTYAMWLMAGGKTRPLGDFRPDAAGNVTMATSRTTGHSPKLVVTLESKTGNLSPTGKPVLSA